MSETRTSVESAADAAELVGSVVGNYRITDELSTGGMGSVFRATHKLLGKDAAVKLIRPELSANPEMVERFFNEARAASSVRHPGIVEVFDFGYHEDGRAYLVMEFLEGESLAARLADGRMSEVQAAVIARGIASALGAAHAAGIVHRDLKPDNVFLVPDPDMPSGERIKVLDFGIAKLGDNGTQPRNQTRTGALMGTPMYMAPEQARAAGAIDARADLYSLGCIIYEMLTGAPPFVAEGAGEIIALQLFALPEAPSTRLAEISDEMDRIVMRLLEKDPGERYQRASQIADALSDAIPTLSGRLSAVLPPQPSLRRPAAIIVPTEAGTAAPTPAPIATLQVRPRRGLGLPVIAGLATLGFASAALVFIVLRDPKPRTEPAEIRPPPIVVPPENLAAKVVAPPAAPSVTYFVELVRPFDATVTIDGAVVELQQGFVHLPAKPDKRDVVVSAPGYQPESFVLEGNQNEHVKVRLYATNEVRRKGKAVERVVESPTPPPDRAGAPIGTGTPGAGVESKAGDSEPAEAKPAAAKTVKVGSGGGRVYTDLDDDD